MTGSDKDIQQKILAKLKQEHQVDASKIQVEVKNGKVTLTGEVSSAEAQSSANWITTGVQGVTGVMNQLTVRRPETTVLDDR